LVEQEEVAGLRRRLAGLYEELQAAAADAEAWIHTPEGADLWIDGITALRCAGKGRFARYLDAFLAFTARMGQPLRTLERDRTAATLALFDPFLIACAEQGPDCFWPALAVGLCLLKALGGSPGIEETPGVAVVNDASMVLLSPSYRAVRFTAYNAGIRTISLRQKPKGVVFRPELGWFFITPPGLVDGEPPCVPFVNVNHDLVHLVLFEDAYLRPVGTPAVTASLLLNAEETACTVDLVLGSELLRYGVDLLPYEHLVRLQAGWRLREVNLMDRIARDPELFVVYQAGLRASTQLHLEAACPLSRQIAGSVPIPEDLADWYDPRSQATHAGWAEMLAERVWNPVFQRFVSLLPPLPGHMENLLRFTRDTWPMGETVVAGGAPELCAASQARGLSLRRLRSMVIRAAELAVELNEKEAAPPALLDGLAAWALAVADDCARAPFRDPETGREERHASAAQGLLARHGVPDPDGRRAALFQDPTGPPSSSEPLS
jgi:hypothetical protein